MKIYKIFRSEEWADLMANGRSKGAPIDVQDGYIHFSTAQQVVETAAKHFAGVEGLMLASADAEAMKDDLKWEVSRGGALFPHLYRELRRDDFAWTAPLPLVEGAHVFPDELS